MKKLKSYLLYVACLTLLLQGCSHDDALTDDSDTGNSGTALTIIARDAGYTSTDGTQTRATDNGYITKFANGDKIGVFGVKNGTVIADCKNVPYTYDGSKWVGKAPYYEGATYFAYYPHDASYDAKASLTDIETAFKAKFDDVTAKDQSDHDKYTAYDLMTAIEVSPTADKIVNFAFTHRMALVVISLPKAKYTFTNGSTIPDYTAPIPDTDVQFTTPQPCRMPDGTYRYLVAPNTEVSFSGSYVDATGTKGYTYSNASGIAASKYKKYVVDRATVVEKSYELAVGDYYMNDGSLVAGTQTLSKAQQTACIGIVFYAGHHASDGSDYSLSGIGQQKCHGYVMALTNVNATGSGGLKWAYREGDGTYDQYVGTFLVTSNWYGYSNTKAIETFVNSSNGSWQMTDFPAANGCLLYGTNSSWQKSYAAPTNSSGWFLPSIGQLEYLDSNPNVLSARIEALSKMLSNPDINWFGSTIWLHWWSSSECNSGAACSRYIPKDATWCTVKNEPLNVRAVCAF